MSYYDNDYIVNTGQQLSLTAGMSYVYNGKERNYCYGDIVVYPLPKRAGM